MLILISREFFLNIKLTHNPRIFKFEVPKPLQPTNEL